MLDLIGSIILVTVIALNISVFSNAMPVSAAVRLSIAAVMGAWTGLAAAAAGAGVFGNTSLPFPWIGAFVAAPPLAVAGAAALSPTMRSALFAIPLPMLIGLNIPRVLGVLFVLLAGVGRLGGPFPYSAGWGDVATGVLAVAAVNFAAQGKGYGAIWGWNALGALDLVAAIALGVTSANGAPLQLIHAGAGSDAFLALPWALVPAVLVPFYLITHGIIFAQLYARRPEVRVTQAESATA
jgi:hypothetical protein